MSTNPESFPFLLEDVHLFVGNHHLMCAFRWTFTRNVEVGIATLLKAYVVDTHYVNATEVLDVAVGTAIKKGTNGYNADSN